MSSIEAPLSMQLDQLVVPLNESLKLWDIPNDSKVSLCNISENFTYLVEGSNQFKAILRVHRENYHTEHAIECELYWKDVLKKSEIVQAPSHFIGKNGRAVQLLHSPSLENTKFLVLFEFVEGKHPDENGDLTQHFNLLGKSAARMHIHSLGWEIPENFSRKNWDLNTIFGNNAIWGNWRDAPQVTSNVKDVLELVESKIKQRLEIYGQDCSRFGLIHSDMRLANLIVDHQLTWIIDFDDCGFGWYLYDFAAGISFMETDTRIPKLKQVWLDGYLSERQLAQVDIDEIDTFVMLRRMALLAWIGSHSESTEPKALADGFAKGTAELGSKYLNLGSLY